VSSPIAGATSGSFSTPPISATANYWVRVTNPLGTADSNTATLTVLPWATLFPGVKSQGGDAALIGTQPQSHSVPAGASATFVVISLWPSVTYQWQVSSGRSWQNISDSGACRGSRTSALIVSPSVAARLCAIAAW
jgi:hypothetical protein